MPSWVKCEHLRFECTLSRFSRPSDMLPDRRRRCDVFCAYSGAGDTEVCEFGRKGVDLYGYGGVAAGTLKIVRYA